MLLRATNDLHFWPTKNFSTHLETVASFSEGCGMAPKNSEDHNIFKICCAESSLQTSICMIQTQQD